MKTIGCWDDFRDYGLTPLTGEACGLMYRILFDVTEQGKKIIDKCFDVKVQLAKPWNNGAGSIMLSREMMIPLGIFALLETGCKEVWVRNDCVLGTEDGDDPKVVDHYRGDGCRIYAYRGTAGSRNEHIFSGRIT